MMVLMLLDLIINDELDTDVLGQCSFYFSGCTVNGNTSINWFVVRVGYCF